MLVWAVNRLGNGPFNAYKNLGDLSAGVPTSANESLTAQAAAVVRGCIANSTISEIICKREMLTGAIKKEMAEVVKGWGVWLETVEITAVQICSQSLFKDLQTNFRESMRQQAVVHQMQINEEIETVKSQNALEVAQKEREASEKGTVYCQKVTREIKEAEERFQKERAEILQEKQQLSVQHEMQCDAIRQQTAEKIQAIALEKTIFENQAAIKNKA